MLSSVRAFEFIHSSLAPQRFSDLDRHAMTDAGGGVGGAEVIHDVPNIIHVYKSGRVERFLPIDFAPPSADAATGVSSKDVAILPGAGRLARVYVPAAPAGGHGAKFPVHVFFHGGGFCLGSAFDADVNGHAKQLAARAGAIVMSVEYRLAPEHPVPALYGDGWAALQWVVAHAACHGPEPWLTAHADLGCVHLGGERAGGNSAPRRNARRRQGAGPRREGEFARADPSLLFGRRQLRVGRDGHGVAPRAGPAVAGGVPWEQRVRRSVDQSDDGGRSQSGRVGCGRVLVCIGGKDAMRGRGRLYYDKLRGSGWRGEVEVWEADGQGHGFHHFWPTRTQAEARVRVITEFLCGR